MCELSKNFDPDFPLSAASLRDELMSLNSSRAKSATEGNQELLRLQHRAGEEKVHCMKGSTIVNASDLPSHSDFHISTISKTRISVRRSFFGLYFIGNAGFS